MFESQVSCVEYSLVYRALLQKTPMFLGSLLIVASPYPVLQPITFGVSLQLQVSFAKEPYKRDYILQKRPIILRSLLIVATPYCHSTYYRY